MRDFKLTGKELKSFRGKHRPIWGKESTKYDQDNSL